MTTPLSGNCESEIFRSFSLRVELGHHRAEANLGQIHEMAGTGVIRIGYVGENEPTYRSPIRPRLKDHMTSEPRWLEQVNIADDSSMSIRIR